MHLKALLGNTIFKRSPKLQNNIHRSLTNFPSLTVSSHMWRETFIMVPQRQVLLLISYFSSVSWSSSLSLLMVSTADSFYTYHFVKTHYHGEQTSNSFFLLYCWGWRGSYWRQRGEGVKKIAKRLWTKSGLILLYFLSKQVEGRGVGGLRGYKDRFRGKGKGCGWGEKKVRG